MLLYNAWQQEHKEPVVSKSFSVTDQKSASLNANTMDDKDIPQTATNTKETTSSEETTFSYHPERHVQVKTDVLNLTIDKLGGDIVKLILPRFAEDQKTYGEGYLLLDQSPKRYYIAQSGLASVHGPDIRGVGRGKLEASQKIYQLEDNQNELTVDLKTHTHQGVEITKRFLFHRGSYVINVEYLIHNKSNEHYKGNFYARLKRKDQDESGGGFLGIQTFTGAAIHTPETPYKKISFKDIQEKPLEQSMQGGWVAMVEHYFVSAWIPPSEDTCTYQTNKLEQGIYSVGLVEPAIDVAPGQEKKVSAKLYAGPEITEDLQQLAPGLELAVDYGILWPICQPIFWLLKKIYHFTGNWGLAIIIITIVIKLLFYKLSATSYRSMGNMRKLQPRLEALKERYGDDKQKFSQSVMELYKKEKINPLGGCFPILVQIPVFIALYYVLLGSVELREAPFIFWITDLSAKDPYYVLPILMGASMLVQQKLNPAPADPIQAKVMMLMPIIFTVLFLSFPSGLVLYWFVNNVLSIAQQWFISRKIELASNSHAAK